MRQYDISNTKYAIYVTQKCRFCLPKVPLLSG